MLRKLLGLQHIIYIVCSHVSRLLHGGIFSKPLRLWWKDFLSRMVMQKLIYTHSSQTTCTWTCTYYNVRIYVNAYDALLYGVPPFVFLCNHVTIIWHLQWEGVFSTVPGEPAVPSWRIEDQSEHSLEDKQHHHSKFGTNFSAKRAIIIHVYMYIRTCTCSYDIFSPHGLPNNHTLKMYNYTCTYVHTL